MRDSYRSHALRLFFRLTAALASVVVVLSAFVHDAYAFGALKLKAAEVDEMSAMWQIRAVLELPSPPLTAHQPMRFIITKVAVYERVLLDGQSAPVLNRVALKNQPPAIETFDVSFADSSRSIWKSTEFAFALARSRGYEAGEYRLEVRTSEGVPIGSAAALVLRGDNPVVDRRAMTFGGNSPAPKSDAGASHTSPSNTQSWDANRDVAPIGQGEGFVPPQGFEKTAEEEIKVRRGGCGCTTVASSTSSTGALGAAAAISMTLFSIRLHQSRRRRAAR